MNAAPLPGNTNDDEIESVAEELLGVDFSSTDELSGPIELDDDNDDLFGDDFDVDLEEPAAGEAVDVEEPEPATAESESAVGFDDEFGGGLDDITDSEPEPEHASRSKPDGYWDALEGWDWDEGAGRAEREAEPAADESVPPQREADLTQPSRPAPKKLDAFVEDDEFGAGLMEEASRAPRSGSAERPPPPERHPPSSAPERPRRRDEDEERRGRDEGERRQDREGRRRQRPERGERRDEARRDRGNRREPPPQTERVSEPPPPPVAESDDDFSDFGSGLDITAEARSAAEELPEREPRRGRRRRGRGRGRDQVRGEPRPPEDTSADDETPEPEFEFEPGEDDQAESLQEEPEAADVEVEPRYPDVPTWAEAISYLVNPKAKSGSRSSEGSSRSAEGESRGGSQRPSGEGDRGRRRGGSRRGGRGRGRRPPSSSSGSE